jgi:N-acetylmuramic acid 6-phosphate etherase
LGEIPVTYEEGAALLKEHGSVRKAVESEIMLKL